MKITLHNDYHNTQVNLIARNGRLSQRQLDRAKKELCGIPGCQCSDMAGIRGRIHTPDYDFDQETGQYFARVRLLK